jgi:hypothetical protein
MTNHKPDLHACDQAPRPSRRARLQALLFTGAALGTTVLTLGATIEPKLPPLRGA